jgi:hypothetical protein
MISRTNAPESRVRIETRHSLVDLFAEQEASRTTVHGMTDSQCKVSNSLDSNTESQWILGEEDEALLNRALVHKKSKKNRPNWQYLNQRQIDKFHS